MRKLIVTEFYSLDGLMSDSEDKQDWITTNFSQDMGKYVEDVYANADTLFLGEVTYQIMATYWPTADTNPEAFQGDAESAHTMNSIRKVVFSKNLKDLAWSNSALKTEIVPEEIKKMKQEPGKDMLVAGSASIVQQPTHFGLVDEYHLRANGPLFHESLLYPMIVLGSYCSMLSHTVSRASSPIVQYRTDIHVRVQEEGA